MPDGARIAGHPLHPILVTLPLGLCTFSFVADLVRGLGAGGPVWSTVALYTLGGGIVGMVLAAVPGLIDFFTITDARVRDIAIAHMVAMVTVLGLFAFSFWLRWIGTVGSPAVRGLDGRDHPARRRRLAGRRDGLRPRHGHEAGGRRRQGLERAAPRGLRRRGPAVSPRGAAGGGTWGPGTTPHACAAPLRLGSIRAGLVR